MRRAPMTCRETVRRMMDYVEGVMPRDDVNRLEHHMQKCPRCVEFLQAYRRTPEILRRSADVRIPRAAARRLWRTVRACQQQQATNRRWTPLKPDRRK